MRVWVERGDWKQVSAQGGSILHRSISQALRGYLRFALTTGQCEAALPLSGHKGKVMGWMWGPQVHRAPGGRNSKTM